jgi:hypothetical protein
VPKDKFGPLQGGRDVVVRTTALQPTLGFEMTIVRESKSLSHTLNFKRRGVVRALVRTANWAVAPGDHLLPGSRPHRRPAMRAEDERELEKYFSSRAREGRVPSLENLESHCRKRGIAASRSFLRGLRYKFKFTAIFSHKRRPKHFMGMAIQRYGVLMLDRAYYDYRRDEDERADAGVAGRGGRRGRPVAIPRGKRGAFFPRTRR